MLFEQKSAIAVIRDLTADKLYIGGEIYPIPKQTVLIDTSPVIFNCNGAGKQTHL